MLRLLLKPIAEAFASAFGRAIADMFGAWLNARKAEELGRAKAESAGRAVIQEIADDQEERAARGLDLDGALKRLRDGTG